MEKILVDLLCCNIILALDGPEEFSSRMIPVAVQIVDDALQLGHPARDVLRSTSACNAVIAAP